MKHLTKEIPRHIYDAAKNNNGVFTDNMLSKVFSPEILCGCGLYDYYVFADGDKYFLSYVIGSSCE